jgi:hypothetical protein
MTRQCTCGGIIRQHQLTGEREAWTCNACGKYSAIRRGPVLRYTRPTESSFVGTAADEWADAGALIDAARQAEAVQVVGDKLARQ